MNQHGEKSEVSEGSTGDSTCAVQALGSSSGSGRLLPSVFLYEMPYALDLGLLSFQKNWAISPK